MKAMILAAGRGSRMQPLTDNTHKGLLKISGITLLEHQIKRVAAIGIKNIVINVSYFAKQIQTEGCSSVWPASQPKLADFYICG